MKIKRQGIYYIGVDLGQLQDFTAISVLERHAKQLHLRHIERLPLGTSYPAVVDTIKKLTDTPQLKQAQRLSLVVDSTGCGLPVLDYLTRAGLRCSVTGISIHGGNTVSQEGNRWLVPKRDLIGGLQVALQNGDLKVAAGLPHGDILITELSNYTMKINLNGNTQFEAWRESIHDDLVLSVALPVWYASKNNFVDNFHNLL